MSYEIDLSSITEDELKAALQDFNGDHSIEFSLTEAGSQYSLVGGDDTYCTGDLKQVAYFWEGYVAGQADGDTSINVDEYDGGR
jgi:hypothetical protein